LPNKVDENTSRVVVWAHSGAKSGGGAARRSERCSRTVGPGTHRAGGEPIGNLLAGVRWPRLQDEARPLTPGWSRSYPKSSPNVTA